MIIGLYDTSYMYDIIRTFENIELPSGYITVNHKFKKI